MVQHENIKRINRITDHKRKRIWDTHMMIKQRNERLKSSSSARELAVRAQSAYECKSREYAVQVLEKLMKADPNRKEHRKQLTQVVEELGKKLGINLENTSTYYKRNPNKEKEEEDEEEICDYKGLKTTKPLSRKFHYDQ